MFAWYLYILICESCRKAKAMIQSVVEKGRQQEEHRHQAGGGGGGGGIVQHLMSGMSGGAGNITFEMLVPGNRVGLVIGKGGETLKRIQVDQLSL